MSDQDDFDGPAITRGPSVARSPKPEAKAKAVPPMKLTALLLVAIVLIALAWAFRWEITPVSGGPNNQASAYMKNRWTGELYLLYSAQTIKVREQ